MPDSPVVTGDAFELVLGPPPPAYGRVPAKRHGHLAPDSKLMANLERLASMPGQWARVAIFGRARAYVLVDDLRDYGALPGDGEWDFRPCRLDADRVGVWARFTPNS